MHQTIAITRLVMSSLVIGRVEAGGTLQHFEKKLDKNSFPEKIVIIAFLQQHLHT